MNTALPDNAINAEIKARLHNSDVNGVNFPLYLSRVTSANEKNYYLINTQLNQPTSTKCGKGWLHSTEIQVIVVLDTNEGSKKLLNEATELLRQELEDFSLTGFAVNKIDLSIENELVTNTESEIVYQKIIRLEIQIN